MVHDYQFVPRAEWLPVRKELEELIHCVQNEVRKYFTFSYTYVGSSHRNLITRDNKSNIGYDFDVNLHINDDNDDYTPKQIRTILRNALDKHSYKYGYGHCEDSTRVLTIKSKDTFFSRIKHSCDFCIVFDCNDGRQQYIHFNKKQNAYNWYFLPVSNNELENRAQWIKDHGHWQELKSLYLFKKNNNTDPNKKSRSLYAEAINEIINIY